MLFHILDVYIQVYILISSEKHHPNKYVEHQKNITLIKAQIRPIVLNQFFTVVN